MSNKNDPNKPTVYHIRVRGHLGRQWADWFGNATITQEENGDTTVSAPVADQPALYGLLRKVRDLGVHLLSVYCESEQDKSQDDKEK